MTLGSVSWVEWGRTIVLSCQSWQHSDLHHSFHQTTVALCLMEDVPGAWACRARQGPLQDTSVRICSYAEAEVSWAQVIAEPAISITVPLHLPRWHDVHISQAGSWMISNAWCVQLCLMCPTMSVNGPGDLVDPPGSKSWLVRKDGLGTHI